MDARRAIPGGRDIATASFEGRCVAGCDGHPGGGEHAAMADELQPVVRELTGV